MKKNIWDHSFWQLFAEHKCLYVNNVPLDVDVKLWCNKDIFFVHNNEWDMYTIDQWAMLYRQYSAIDVIHKDILNKVLSLIAIYKNNKRYCNILKSLWLSLFSDSSIVWLHPEINDVFRDLSQDIQNIIDLSEKKWIICNYDLQPAISWNALS